MIAQTVDCAFSWRSLKYVICSEHWLQDLSHFRFRTICQLSTVPEDNRCGALSHYSLHDIGGAIHPILKHSEHVRSEQVPRMSYDGVGRGTVEKPVKTIIICKIKSVFRQHPLI